MQINIGSKWGDVVCVKKTEPGLSSRIPYSNLSKVTRMKRNVITKYILSSNIPPPNSAPRILQSGCDTMSHTGLHLS